MSEECLLIIKLFQSLEIYLDSMFYSLIELL
jgi:hypothetical protein